ncbi:OLC1v1005636C1 [Oldenlandia corymbosa var. corymbosa]|uniref:OLC1v1005636C1 n=1 Tax=Oldenlandia corymbosa var. corymbosa TaxID=529605 RepID=A0AAV1DFB9_OLDCO|nr:OLC1v1005636C1 [Oldenlandia corymbosa var. corymbosa]
MIDMIQDRKSGDVAADSYHLYKEDVALLKKMNMDAYRFSISWTRLLPRGRISGGINERGIEYYNKLIDHLIANGLKPVVTLFHWDTPQSLEDEYGGFLGQKIIDDFREYANLCFQRYGDRVKDWITLNEPFSYAVGGYDSGYSPPNHCSVWKNQNCKGGDSGTEPYRVMHNMILAHANAVKVYKTKYQAHQKGKVGMSIVSGWAVPFSNSLADRNATYRALDFQIGWNLWPLVYGEYPNSMQMLVGKRLPKFTKEESDIVKGSFDFVGLNYYTANYVKGSTNHNSNTNASFSTDARADSLVERQGKLIGPEAGSSWLHFYPRGLRDMLLYVKHKFNNPVIYITENGVDEKDDPSVPLETALRDYSRIKYYYWHLKYLHIAIREGVKVKGYFGWAALDNFEWNSGYTVRFGLNYVDYRNGNKRYPKLSARWFSRFLSRPTIHEPHH